MLLISAHLFKHDATDANVLSRTHPRTSHQPCPYVTQDITVQVGHNHDIKLMGVGDELVVGEGGRGREQLQGIFKKKKKTDPPTPPCTCSTSPHAPPTYLLDRSPYLHAAVINDHGFELNVGVERGHLLTLPKEQSIRHFPERRVH